MSGMSHGHPGAPPAGGGAGPERQSPQPSEQARPPEQAGQAVPPSGALPPEQARRMQLDMLRKEGIPPGSQAYRIIQGPFEAALQKGGITREAIDHERAYIHSIRKLVELGRESRGRPTPEQQARMSALDRDAKKAMSGMGDLHMPLMQAIGRHFQDPDIAMEPMELVRHLREFSRGNPNDPRPRRILGHSHLKHRRWGDALEEFNEALRLDPGDGDALGGRSQARFQSGDYRGAVEDAKALLRLDPGNAAALAMLKLTEGRRGPSAEGGSGTTVEAAPAAPAAQPAPPSPARALAASSGENVAQSDKFARQAAQDLQIADLGAAVRDAARAIEYNDKNARAFNLRATALIRLGQNEAALLDAEHALSLVPKDRVSTNTKAYILDRLGRYREAKALLQESGFGLDSGDAEVLYNLAYAEAGLGNREAMLDALNRAAVLNPRFGQAYQTAVEAPEGADLKLLFAGQAAPLAAAAAAAASKGGANRRFFLIVLASLAGGLLTALGFLHVLTPGRSLKSPWAADAAGDGFEDVVVPGAYKVVRKIGSGGMGTVFEALDLNLHRTVALKMMRPEIREDVRQRRLFLKEARTVAKLKHPNIVEIYSIEEKVSELYLVFEYVEGRTLDQLLEERGRLEFAEARRLLKEVCDALQYAHAGNVIHRDLKPSNIMLARSGAVKVMDFGVARQVKDAMNQLSMTNAVYGTPPYMAPEAEQGIIGKESDVYALGVCLYELLGGEVPFAGTGAGMLLNKMNKSFRPLSSRVRGLPPGLDEVVARALEPDPSKRIQTPAEFGAALESLAA